MLVAITMVSALNTKLNVEAKESPLFGIKNKKAIGEKIENIKTSFLERRIFFMMPDMQQRISQIFLGLYTHLDTVHKSCCPVTCYTLDPSCTCDIRCHK